MTATNDEPESRRIHSSKPNMDGSRTYRLMPGFSYRGSAYFDLPSEEDFDTVWPSEIKPNLVYTEPPR